jgi:hypothetical protein
MNTDASASIQLRFGPGLAPIRLQLRFIKLILCSRAAGLLTHSFSDIYIKRFFPSTIIVRIILCHSSRPATMRSLLFFSGVLGLVCAAPRPQDIDFELAEALPDLVYSEAVGVTAQVITYDASAVFSSAAAQITATVVKIDGAVIATGDAASNQKRDACAAQQAQPLGFGPVPSPDTASAFLQSRHWTDLRSGPLDRFTGPCTGPDLSCGPVDRISTGVQWTVH